MAVKTSLTKPAQSARPISSVTCQPGALAGASSGLVSVSECERTLLQKIVDLVLAILTDSSCIAVISE